MFISLRESELKKVDKQEADGPNSSYTPTVKKNGFCGLFCSSCCLHLKSSFITGYICNIFVAALAFSLAGILSHYTMRTVDEPLNYSDMAQIYDSVLPMDIYYNSLVGPPFSIIPKPKSTKEFMEALNTTAGNGTLTLHA